VFLDLAVFNRIPSVTAALGGAISMHGAEKYSYNFNRDRKRQIEKQRQIREENITRSSGKK
jgi:hypothetical protein